MRRGIAIIEIGLACALAWTCPVSAAHAEVIDKIAAVVDGAIITLSDIRKEHQIQTVLADHVESDDVILKTLIDRHLIDEEMAQYPGLEVTDDEIEERMKTVTDLHGVPAPEIRNAISGEIQRFKYFSLRYRQFIVVSNEEIANYYNTQFVPEAQKRGVAVPDLSAVEAGIRANLFEEKVNDEQEKSMETLRERSNIEILQ
jgi:parvulin-like peptidyl-prolyl isomerase